MVGNFWITTQAKPPITTPRASGPRGGNGWFGACGNSKITNHECGGAFTTSLAQNMTFSNGESKLKKRYPPDLIFLLKWRHIHIQLSQSMISENAWCEKRLILPRKCEFMAVLSGFEYNKKQLLGE